MAVLATQVDEGEVGPSGQLSATAWVKFCVELMSLAFADGAPVALPAVPGSAEFVRMSERLLTSQKTTIRLSPATRARNAGERF